MATKKKATKAKPLISRTYHLPEEDVFAIDSAVTDLKRAVRSEDIRDKDGKLVKVNRTTILRRLVVILKSEKKDAKKFLDIKLQ